jgi:hypothetical protein
MSMTKEDTYVKTVQKVFVGFFARQVVIPSRAGGGVHDDGSPDFILSKSNTLNVFILGFRRGTWIDWIP